MGRKKIYQETRIKPALRLTEELHGEAMLRAADLKLTFNAYVENLIIEDLLLSKAEKRKQKVAELKKGELANE